MRRSDAPAPRPPAAYRKSVPCPLCGGAIGYCRACRGERRATVYLPLRRLTDGELRVHASQLLDQACGFYGHPSVWVASGDRLRIPPSVGQALSSDLSYAFGFFSAPHVRAWSLDAAREAGKVGAFDAVRALCEVARRARRGSYGPPERVSDLAPPACSDDY